MSTLSRPDGLDTLSDAALSELVALEIAGWRQSPLPFERGGMRLPNAFGSPGVDSAWWHPTDPDATGVYVSPPRFAASADHLLPYLTPHRPNADWWKQEDGTMMVDLQLFPEDGDGKVTSCYTATAATLPRAGCIALIRMTRAHATVISPSSLHAQTHHP